MFGRTLVKRLFSSGAHHAPTPTRLPKVSERSIWLNVKNAYGVYERVVAFPGQSLVQALLRSKVPGHLASCDGGDPTYRPHERPLDPMSGGPLCGTCQIKISDPWIEKLNRQQGKSSEDEQIVLDASLRNHPNARLACCIPVESWMNEMSLEVLPTDDLDDGR